MHSNSEIEVRFLEIDAGKLKAKLKSLKALDLGEDFFEEIIFYDKNLEWQKSGQTIVRIRNTKNGIFLSYKHKEFDNAIEAEEIEFKIDNIDRATLLLERVGLVAYRHQQKKRHTFKIDDVMVDIDTWPKIPTYVELEGPSEVHLKSTAKALELDWAQVITESPRTVIEKYYHIPINTLKFFTFEKVE